MNRDQNSLGNDEADALMYLAVWINIEGDQGEVNDLMDHAAARIPEKVERGEEGGAAEEQL
jgi:hypothetical protein